jgi:hypothetical protein
MELSMRQKRHIVSVRRKTVIKQEFISTIRTNTVGIQRQNPTQNIKTVPTAKVAIEIAYNCR